MKIFIHVLQEDTKFADLEGILEDEFGFSLVDGDWAMEHAFTSKPGSSVGAICATTWIDVEGGRVYYEIGRGSSLCPRFFKGDSFPHGTQVLVTIEENPADDGTGGHPPAEPAQ
ncbi:MAG: hypothetical protein WAV48_02295 [Candidatus Magasanikiibacteriota bacterium]